MVSSSALPATPPRDGAKPPTAAAIVVGNELLSGKIADANVQVLAQALRAIGVTLARVVMVPDDIAIIADEIGSLMRTHDWLFTSGGVGPTHDDVTIDAVARAYGRAVTIDPTLASMLRAHYGPRCTDGHLRMALVPEGAELARHADVRWPTIRVENTWLLPGVPEIFRMKLPVAIEAIRRATPATAFVSRAVFTRMDEGDLKALLDAVVARFPEVEVGSYPRWPSAESDARLADRPEAGYRTKLTFDGTDVVRVDAARDAFLASLPAGEPLHVA